MQLTIYHRLILLLLVVVATVPTIVQAREIKVDTGNVRVTTNSNGKISVQTDQSKLSLPRRRLWSPWRYWQFPNRASRSYCSYTRQSSSHTTISSSSSSGKIKKMSTSVI